MADHATELFQVASREFLFLTAFRQRVRKGLPLDVEDTAYDLDQILADQTRGSRKDPKLEVLYDKARYPLVVLADELLLHSGWDHAAEWDPYLLEEKIFKTNIGGDQFFSIARDLRPDDVELASIIYAGLALGFRGKYRERPEKLSEAKKKVYRLLSEYLADVSEEKITPDAYHVMPQSAKRLSPAVTLAKVAIAGFSFIVLYYLLTWLIWSLSLSDLRQLVTALGG